MLIFRSLDTTPKPKILNGLKGKQNSYFKPQLEIRHQMSLNLISQNHSKNANNNSVSLITVILDFLNRFNWKKQSIGLQTISEKLKENKSPRWYFRMMAHFFKKANSAKYFGKYFRNWLFANLWWHEKKIPFTKYGYYIYRNQFNGYKSSLCMIWMFTECHFCRLKVNLICNFTFYRKTTKCLEIVFIKRILEKQN